MTILKQQRSAGKLGVAKQKLRMIKNNDKEGQSYDAGTF